MKIGFTGLGQMGKGMALNLSKCGQDFMVNDIDDKSFADFKNKGIRATTNVHEIADSDILFLCLPNEKIVEAVLFGDRGIVPAMKAGQIIVDCSTINYMAALRIARQVEDAGIAYMDAPVSGMQSKAEDGTLAIMCGGGNDVFDKVKKYLDLMGTTVRYMGKHGSGQLAKMINNCVYDINCMGIAELLPMAVKLGLDPEQIGEVVNNGTGRSYASEYFIPRMLKRDFAYGFTLKNAYKDLVSAAEVAAAEAIPTPVLDAVASVYKMTMLKGYGDSYKGVFIRFYEDLLGVKFEKKNI